MANIFRSKEVYKKHGESLYAVRGMHVAGIHKEPYYIDHVLNINSIQTTKAVVEEYTSLEIEHDNAAVGIVGVGSSNLIITQYTTAAVNTSADAVVGIIGVNTVSELDILRFTSRDVQTSMGEVVGVIGANVSDLDIILYDDIPYNHNREYLVCIKEISTTKATIT